MRALENGAQGGPAVNGVIEESMPECPFIKGTRCNQKKILCDKGIFEFGKWRGLDEKRDVQKGK